MKNIVIKGLFIGFAIVSLVFFKITFDDVKQDNETYHLINNIDNQVIERLIMARELQVHYASVRGEFASEWDSLFSFLATDSIYAIQQNEIIIKRPYGGDSIYLQIDTLGAVAAYDSLKNKLGGIPLEQVERIKYAPGHPKDSLVTFFIDAKFVKKSPVFEVVDPKPLNPKRQKSKKRGGLPPLKVGSLQGPSLKGNWEY